MFCCLRTCLNRVNRSDQPFQKSREPDIQLDLGHMGQEVVIIKNGRRLCGSGAALASVPLQQSKSYFEVKIQQSGIWSVGIATRQADLDQTVGGSDNESWCIGSDAVVRHNNTEIHIVEKRAQSIESNEKIDVGETLLIPNTSDNTFVNEGDTIGIAFDHVELNFYLNGKNLEVPVLNAKGTVYPVLYVDDGAILDIVLDNFAFAPPPGFDRIMIEQSIL